MSIKDKFKTGGSKALRVAMSGVLAVGLMPLPAFAEGLQASSADLAPQSTVTAQASKSIDGLVIGDAYAAANPAPEILGLSNPSQRAANEGQTTYEFFGNPDVNTNPDPFLYNYVNGGTPSFFIGTHGGGPMTALKSYSSSASAPVQGVWNLMPHVILGTGADTLPSGEYPTKTTVVDEERNSYADSARALETDNGLEANSYNPIGVTYDRVDLPSMIKTMYRLANAADEVIANSNGTLLARYSGSNDASGRNATVNDIAKEYERYILGQKGIVKQAIDTGAVQEKTIALVQSYDSSSGNYTIITDGVAEGTATTNRYLEAVQGVTKNYYDTVGASGSTAVTKEQLKNNVNYIIIGGNAGSDSNTLVTQLTTDGLIGKTYYCTNWDNGSSFGTTVNSVENAQNVGRILPCVYPEQLDQHDMIAYYYDVFYHVKADGRSAMIDAKMDGVRNGSNNDSSSYTTWTANDVKDYNYATVENKLKAGVGYLNMQKGKLSSYLTPTDELAGDSAGINLSAALVAVPAKVGSSSPDPEPTVTLGSTTLEKGTDYTVTYTYSADGKTGTATVKGAGTEASGYYGTKTATFSVIDAADITDGTGSKVTITLDNPSPTFTGEAIEPTVTVTLDGTQLTKGTDYIVSYANNTNAAESTADNAPIVTITGIGAHSGTATKKFTIQKLTPTISVKASSSTVTYGSDFDIAMNVDKAYLLDGGSLTVTPSNKNVFTASYDKGKGSGKPTGLGAGTVTVKADSEKTTPNCTTPAEVTSDSITVAPLAAQTVTAGDLNVTFTTVANAYKWGVSTDGGGNLKYKYTDESGAVTDGITDLVSISGQYFATKKIGTYTVTAQAEAKMNGSATLAGASAAKSFTLTIGKLAAQTVSFSRVPTGKLTMKYGGSAVDLKAASNGDGALSFASSKPSVATVDGNGVVTAVGIGTTTITATAAETDNAGEGEGVCTVTVTGEESTIALKDYSTAWTGKAIAYPIGNASYVTSTGSTGAKSVKYYSDSACTKEVAAANVVNVGTYYVKGTVAADANHPGATSAAAKLTVTKATIAVPAGKTLTYSGAQQTGVAAGAYYTVTGNTGTDAKSYTATLTADSNHTFSSGATATVAWKISPASLASITPALTKASSAYTGKAQKGAVKSVTWNGKTLKSGTDYTVSAKSGKAAGSYKVTVAGKGNFTGTSKAATFKITQAANTAKAAKTSVTKKLTANKKTKKLAKATTVALPKVTTKFGTAKWKVKTKDKKGFLTLSGSKIKVKAGAKKGTTYTIKVQGSVTKTSNYKAASTKVVTVKVTVK